MRHYESRLSLGEIQQNINEVFDEVDGYSPTHSEFVGTYIFENQNFVPRVSKTWYQLRRASKEGVYDALAEDIDPIGVYVKGKCDGGSRGLIFERHTHYVHTIAVDVTRLAALVDNYPGGPISGTHTLEVWSNLCDYDHFSPLECQMEVERLLLDRL